MSRQRVEEILNEMRGQGVEDSEVLTHILYQFLSGAKALEALESFIEDTMEMSVAEFLGEEDEEEDDEEEDENWHYENGFRWWATDSESGEDLPSLDEDERGQIYDQMQKGYSSGQLVTSRHEENEDDEANEEEGTDKEYIGWWESL